MDSRVREARDDVAAAVDMHRRGALGIVELDNAIQSAVRELDSDAAARLIVDVVPLALIAELDIQLRLARRAAR